MKRLSVALRAAPRWAVYTGVGVLALGAGILTAVLVGSPVPPDDGADPSPSSPTRVVGVEDERSMLPGEVIGTVVDDAELYAMPGDSRPIAVLPKWTYYGKPTTVLATATATIGGDVWYQVKAPIEPNGTSGWLPASQVHVSSTDLSIHVFLADHELELRRGSEVLLTATVAVGADDTPTPLGLYFVTDPLPFANPDGVYGAYALGLSGYSEVLEEFAGGPPQIAIHGTNLTDSLGKSVSNGCIRVSDEVVLQLADQVVLGTPVFIEAERGAASAPDPV